ncbi:IPT/TIG domain-containing protein [Streptomyces sp. NPDC019937]|uniref:IPT/TIG domain-containing protein n=1 Tax=Streptomyces sp. NPDC019937 TaxID=3154787 RepID=UPI0033FC130E
MTSTDLVSAAASTEDHWPWWPPSPVGPPLLLTVVPNSGPTSGGNLVQLTGVNLRNVISVTFGGVPAAIVSQNGNDTVVVVAPSHAAGSVQVLVITVSGTSNSQPYTYIAPPPPTATSITPAFGPTTGGTVFVINGTNLNTVTSVTFANVPATIVAVNPAGTQLVGITPPGAAGTAAVVVTGPGGAVTVPGGFTYFVAPPPPVATTITPNTGTAAGGTPFTITGTNLGGVLGVLFNGVPATSVAATATTVTGVTPPGVVGPATVTLVTATGTTTVPGGYTYT